MAKKLNTMQKKLKFHCSVCFTIYQLLEVQRSLKTTPSDKCLNNCAEKWQTLLFTYCQEQIILALTRQEQAKDDKEKILTDWLSQINKNHQS